MKTVDKVMEKLFPLAIGTRIKVVRIWYKSRNRFIKPLDFIGRTGRIIGRRDTWIYHGWWTKPPKDGKGQRIDSYSVKFDDLQTPTQWVFMRKDLEVIP